MLTVHGRRSYQMDNNGNEHPAIIWSIRGPVNGAIRELCHGETGPVPYGKWASTGGKANAAELQQQAQALLLLATVISDPDDYAAFIKD